MKISGIYKIQSIRKPERCYIGSAVTINKRWGTHLAELRRDKHKNKKLQHHYNKHGESDLVFSILLGCERDYLIANEQFFIDSYKPYFNIRIKADSNYGLKCTEETRQKMSASQFKRGKRSDEQRRLMSISQKRVLHRPHSEETKRKMSIAGKGKKKPPFTESHKLKIAEAHTGKKRPPFTKETIERMKEAWVVRKNKKAS